MSRTNNVNISIILSVALLIIYISFSSCKKIPNPYANSDEKDTITYNLLKTSIAVQFFDANTNEYIIPEGGELLKVQIVGKSKNAVADIVGLQKDEYTLTNGIITFGLIPEAEFVPSQTTPICFTIISRLQNYLTATKEVMITAEGDYLLKVFMVRIDDPPPGVIIKRLFNVGNLVNGVLQDTISIATGNSEATIIIPGGVRLLNSDSIELVGNFNLSLVYFNNLEDKALAAFTGGGLTGSLLENSNTNSGVFFPAGLLTFEICDINWSIASIIEDDSLEIIMKISEQTYNPVSGSNIVVGDMVSLYSYLPDTGLWVFDQSNQVTDTLLNGLTVKAKTPCLNSLVFSWFEKNNCNQGSSFKVSGNCAQCNSVMFGGVVRKQADNSFVSNISCVGQWNETINIPFSTGGTPVYINWAQGDECNFCNVDPVVSPLFIDDMCSQQLIDLPFSDNGPVSKSINAYFVGTCVSDTNIIVLPSFNVWVRSIDATCWRWSSMKNGTALICDLIYGETYVIGTYYDGNWKEWEITITEETNYKFNMEFSQSVCSGVFGIL